MENSSADRVRDPFHTSLALPAALRARPQWVTWRLQHDGKRGVIKLLFNPVTRQLGSRARANDPTTWGSYEQAVSDLHAQHRFYEAGVNGKCGVGYVVSADDPFVLADLDHVAENGVIRPKVAALVAEAKTYTEFSQSLTGLHLVVEGSLAHLVRPGMSGARNAALGFEAYYDRRFFALTGDRVEGTHANVTANQPWVDNYFDTYLSHARTPEAGVRPPRETSAPRTPRAVSTGRMTLGDAVAQGQRLAELPASNRGVIAAARRATNGGKFSRLFDATDGNSEDVMALTSLIAWWVGPDEARLSDIFWASNLALTYHDQPKLIRTWSQYTLPRVLASATTWRGKRGSI